MYISENKLRKIIKSAILNESVDQESSITTKGGFVVGNAIEIGERTSPKNAAVITIGVPKKQLFGQNDVVIVRSKNSVKFNFNDRDTVFKPIEVKDLENYKFISKNPITNVELTADSIMKRTEEGRLAIVPLGKYAGKEITAESGIGMEITTLLLDTIGTFGTFFGPGGAFIGGLADIKSSLLKYSQGKYVASCISLLGAMPGIGDALQVVFGSLKTLIALGAASIKQIGELLKKIITNLGNIIQKISSEDYRAKIYNTLVLAKLIDEKDKDDIEAILKYLPDVKGSLKKMLDNAIKKQKEIS